MPDHVFQQGGAPHALRFQLAHPQIDRGGEAVFFIDRSPAGNLDLPGGNTRCECLQDFGEPVEARKFRT